MKKFIDGLLLLVILTVPILSRGEDIFDPEGKRPVMTISEKAKLSRNRASFIAEGHFVKARSGVPSQILVGDTDWIEVEFHIARQLDRNKLISSPLQLNINAYRPIVATTRPPVSGPFVMSRQVERDSGGKKIVYQEYLNALKQARLPLLTAQNYLQEFVLVPIRVGGLDVPDRETDVVVEFTKKYTIFIFNEIDKSKEIKLFKNNWDIYSSDEPELMGIF
jgi:hypothetical protein